ncbi:MAG: FAD-binding domain-containing protein [Leptolyngbyaceae bacterium]|nr:FAD-binding domain-containing protein [Leptolyngbyaceae bacterium]
MTDLILFWHRRDLRLTDNVALVAARHRSAKVVGVFCFDPTLLRKGGSAPARVTYMVESLRELQASYAKAGGQLLFLYDDPLRALPQLASALQASQVFWNRDVEPYAAKRDRAISDTLQSLGIEVHAQWDQLLHSPGMVRTGNGDPYTVYTPFWKNWIQQPKAAPLDPVTGLMGLTATETERAIAAGVIPLPTAKDLGFLWDKALFLSPGEVAAQAQLTNFCQSRGGIGEYEQQRNVPSVTGTSALSAALKFGTIGIRTVWAEAMQAMEYSRSDESRTSIETWQKELAWREFYQHALYFFPELADGPYRAPFKQFPWVNDTEQFQRWCQGQTGYPVVDAAMRQLNQTGWMHNRCRMIVASFLTKDLIIDWRWGEQYFMETLIDGDLAANNGGWQWSASSGMDPKPLRIFNPASQAKKFDPEADYIRQWVPELRGVATKALVTGDIPKMVRDRLPYPAPIVDHQRQQQQFKILYKKEKEKQ